MELIREFSEGGIGKKEYALFHNGEVFTIGFQNNKTNFFYIKGSSFKIHEIVRSEFSKEVAITSIEKAIKERIAKREIYNKAIAQKNALLSKVVLVRVPKKDDFNKMAHGEIDPDDMEYITAYDVKNLTIEEKETFMYLFRQNLI